MDVDVFIDLFLKGESLERFFVHACQGTQGSVSDPITKTICTFITSPIQITLTQVWLMCTVLQRCMGVDYLSKYFESLESFESKVSVFRLSQSDFAQSV